MLIGTTEAIPTLPLKDFRRSRPNATPSWMRTARVIQADDRAPTFMAWSMTLQIFSACAPGQRAAKHREILAEGKGQAAPIIP